MALLEVDAVSVRFGGILAVDAVSLGVETGRVAGLIGPNGAGKTTLFNVITGLLAPTSGRVLYDGKDITRARVHARAQRRIARTFQRLEVFGSLTVYENILVSAEIHRGWNRNARDPRDATREAIARIGLEPWAAHPSDAVPTGIARLTELGRALAVDPRLLLLDEPSSGLSEEETEEFGALLVDLAAEGRAILLVEHDVELVMRVCEWIDVLDFGRIVASGSAAEVRVDPVVQAAYLGADTAVAG